MPGVFRGLMYQMGDSGQDPGSSSELGNLFFDESRDVCDLAVLDKFHSISHGLVVSQYILSRSTSDVH